MPSHHEIQSRFAKALLNPDAPTPKNLLGLGDEEPRKRYGVYRNNVTLSLIDSLKATFPVVLRLVGPGMFEPMALEFIRQSPPTSPMLMKYGEHFPDFISQFKAAKPIAYLPDIARCELHYLHAYHAKDATPIPIDALGAYAPEIMPELSFTCHPSAQFFSSEWPVGSIWFTNKFDDEVKSLDSSRGGENILFIRPQVEVVAHLIASDMSKFLMLITAKKSLGEAAEKVVADFPEFNLQNSLGAMFHFGLITNIHKPE